MKKENKIWRFIKGWLIFVMVSFTLDAGLDNTIAFNNIDVPEIEDDRTWEFVWESIMRKIRAIVKHIKSL